MGIERNIMEKTQPKIATQGQWEDIVGKTASLLRKVEFIFPKFWAGQYSQDCSIVKGYGKVICIDCGVKANWNNILAMLEDNGVKHIDYFILSHYHGDHMGNIYHLIDYGIINEDTAVFLPVVPNVEKYSDVFPTENAVKAALSAANVPYRTPAEKETVVIAEDFKMTFGNVNEEYLTETQPHYNSCSMACLVTYKDTCALFNGDNGTAAYRYLYNTDFVPRTVDIYKQGHHGIDTFGYTLFSETTAPRFVVQMGGIMDYRKNNFLSQETAYLTKNGSLYYPTCMQTDYIKFISDGEGVECISGKNFSTSGGRISDTLYVDANATNDAIQDGTQAHPFRELMQAITAIRNYPNSIVYIYLADGVYGVGHESTGTNNSKNKISIALSPNIEVDIRGNSEDRSAVVISNVYCYGSFVRFYSLTINKDGDSTTGINSANGVELYNSSVRLDNVHITSLSGNKAGYGVVSSQGSRLHMTNSKIEYSTRAVRNLHASTFLYDGLSFDHCDYLVSNWDGYAGPTHILASSTDSVATLSDNVSSFQNISIQYRDSNNNRTSVNLSNVSVGQKIALCVPYISSSGVVTEERATLTITNERTLTLSGKYKITYQNGSTAAITSQQSSGGIRIQQVWGCYDYGFAPE